VLRRSRPRVCHSRVPLRFRRPSYQKPRVERNSPPLHGSRTHRGVQSMPCPVSSFNSFACVCESAVPSKPNRHGDLQLSFSGSDSTRRTMRPGCQEARESGRDTNGVHRPSQTPPSVVVVSNPWFCCSTPAFSRPRHPARRLQRGRVHFLFLGQNSAVNECF